MAVNAPDHLARVSRLACFGSEDGTFHVLKKQDYFNEQMESIKSLFNLNRGHEVVKRLKTISHQKCYAKKDSVLFSLASIIQNFSKEPENHAHDASCKEAFGIVRDLCDTPSDLFTFVHFDKHVRDPAKVSWGRGMRHLISNWYGSRPPLVLARQVTQCKSGHGFSHKDIIKQAHIKCDGHSKGTNLVLNYLLNGKKALEKDTGAAEDEEAQKVVSLLENVERLKSSQPAEKEILRSLIETSGFVDKQIPTNFLKIKEVFEGLIGHNSLASLVKSVPKMAELGLLDPMCPDAERVIKRLSNAEAFKQENVSPVAVFTAMRQYDVNRNKKWIRNARISQALHSAYEVALEGGVRTGKRYLLAIHVDSRIIKTCVTGSSSTLTPIMPCAIIAQMLAKVEDNPQLVYFNAGTTSELSLTRTSNTVSLVEQMVQRTKELANENYNICDPLRWATQSGKLYDCILIVCGKKRLTSQADLQAAIRGYRAECGVPEAKVAIIGLSDPTPLPDRDDLHYLDVTGFDEDVLTLIQCFFQGFPQ